jgi:lipopolysaccharide/colanic/teichoic acid biosynthesis glycosyltransferase
MRLATHTDPRPLTPELLARSGKPARGRKAAEAVLAAAVAATAGPRALPRGYLALKAAAEFALALLLSLATLPVLLAAALIIKLTSRGPAFYSQVRLGKGGRPFTIYKLRTMIHDCESLTGPRWATCDDPRVTPVGQLLRISHIDELPQLFNVLKGDMGLIGPRPERPEFVRELERLLPGYRDRLAIRPGVTGLAQVQLSADTDVSCVRRKLACDLHYVANLGPSLDVRILLATALYVLGNPLRLTRWLVPSHADLEGDEPAFGPDVLMSTVARRAA